jgi:hypothetical protein
MPKNKVRSHLLGIDSETLKRVHFHPVSDLSEVIHELRWHFRNGGRRTFVPDGAVAYPADEKSRFRVNRRDRPESRDTEETSHGNNLD